jgi:hypothetical protein
MPKMKSSLQFLFMVWTLNVTERSRKVTVYRMLGRWWWWLPGLYWCRIPPRAGPASPVLLQVVPLSAAGILSGQLPWQQQLHWRVQKTDWDQSDPPGPWTWLVFSLVRICSLCHEGRFFCSSGTVLSGSGKNITVKWRVIYRTWKIYFKLWEINADFIIQRNDHYSFKFTC